MGFNGGVGRRLLLGQLHGWPVLEFGRLRPTVNAFSANVAVGGSAIAATGQTLSRLLSRDTRLDMISSFACAPPVW